MVSHKTHLSELESFASDIDALSKLITGAVNSYLTETQKDYKKTYLLTKIIDGLFAGEEDYWNKACDLIEQGIDELHSGVIKKDIPYLIYAIAIYETRQKGSSGKIHSFFENFMANTFEEFGVLQQSEILALMMAE